MSKEILGGLYKGVAYRVQINRPERLNAMNRSMWTSLKEELSNACSSNARVVLLTGNEQAFSSGDDIDSMYRLETAEESQKFFYEILGAVEAMLECPKPIVCEVRGLAAGGGAELLLGCDVVVASENAWISFPEVALGLLPPFLVSLGVGALGHRKARYLALTGSRVSAREAVYMGIVDEVATNAELQNLVDELIATLASFPQDAITLIKRRVLESARVDLLKEAVEDVAKLAMTLEAKERMRMFKEHKYKPAALRDRRKLC
ncbi:MAG: enoyl-CoA hydratase/isomerase family protein [Acidilobus sp.]